MLMQIPHRIHQNAISSEKNHFFLGQDLASSPYLSHAVQLFSGLHASAKEAVMLRVVLVGLHEQREKSLQSIV